MARTQITIPLDISNVTVLDTVITAQGEIVITVESMEGQTRCRKCGQAINKYHGQDDWVLVRHLDILDRPTYLRYRPKRYRCNECAGHPTTTEVLAWHDGNSSHTKAYDDHVLLALINATIEDVSQKEGLTYDCVQGVLERRIATSVNWQDYTSLEVLGLDEIALKKGHRNFVVIVTARLSAQHTVILGVLPDRQQTTVEAFLQSIPESLRATVHSVCSDMYVAYIQAAQAILPNARIVIDRFHLATHYREGADKLRRTELKRLKKELSEADYKQLKGATWAFRKSNDALEADPEEHSVLQRLFTYSPDLKSAYDFREDLTAIFDSPHSKDQAQTLIRDWVRRVRASGLTCFDDFLGTLDRWLDLVTNYFVDRLTSGFVEGLNNKIKVLKRRCYGLFNLDHLFQRIFLDLEGYRLFA